MGFLCPAKLSRCSRIWCVGILSLVLSACSTMAQDSPPAVDTLTQRQPKEYKFSLVFGLGGYLGSYHNLSEQRGDPASPFTMGSYSRHLCGEIGLAIGPLGLTFHGELGSSAGGWDAKDYDEVANRTRSGVRISWSIMNRHFHFIPETGWVFWDEEARIYDTEEGRSDLYHEVHRDDGLSYGLASRVRIIPMDDQESEGGLYLHVRYVKDDLIIRADNYWMELQFFVRFLEPWRAPKTEPPYQRLFLALGARWTSRADGRSESYLSLRLGSVIGLF